MKYKKSYYRRPDKIIVIDKKKLGSVRKGLLNVGMFRFEKRMVFTGSDGYSSSEIPFEETLVFISKRDTAIWLKTDEIKALKELLDEITEQGIESLAKTCEVKA